MNESSKQEIVDELAKVFGDINNVLTNMDNHKFELSVNNKWSPKANLIHLLQSTKPIIDALNMPKLTFLVFGKAKTGSLSYDEVVSKYQKALSEGGKATDKYIPSEKMVAKDKTELLSFWNNSIPLLEKALDKWSEEELDKHRIPHPLIGKMTFREMLLFMIYHTGHHLRTLSK